MLCLGLLAFIIICSCACFLDARGKLLTECTHLAVLHLMLKVREKRNLVQDT